MPGARPRIAGLDAWRACLMLGGVLFHAIPEGTDAVPLLTLGWVSQHFRMGAFMAISGFLTGMVAARKQAGPWLSARFATLLMPLSTGVAITVPIMAALRLHFAAGPLSPATLLGNWYHLWFLVALIAYLPLAAALAFGPTGAAIARTLTAQGEAGNATQARLLALVCALSFTLHVLGMLLQSQLATDGPTLADLLPPMLGYAPLYAAGILLGRDERLCRHALGRVRLPLAAIFVVAALEGSSVAWPFLFGPARHLVQAFSSMALPVMAAFLILRSALSVRRIPSWMAWLCDASLTVYVVHFPIAKLLQALLSGAHLSAGAEYLIVVPVTAAASLAIHYYAVAPSATMRWMFNGKHPAPADALGTRAA